MASQRLPERELDAAHRAAVRARLGRRCRRVGCPRALVARAVPAQRLERREPAVARLALEHARRGRRLAAAAAREQQHDALGHADDARLLLLLSEREPLHRRQEMVDGLLAAFVCVMIATVREVLYAIYRMHGYKVNEQGLLV